METQVNERVSTDTRILTEEDYERLAGMLRSNDEENHLIAQQMLVRVDVEKSIYWIWKLSKVNCNRMVNLRTKLGRKFRDDTDLFSITYQKDQEFAKTLERRGWLTPELYQRLLPGIRSEIKGRHTNPFYNFHISIKNEYNHLDPDDKLTPIDTL